MLQDGTSGCTGSACWTESRPREAPVRDDSVACILTRTWETEHADVRTGRGILPAGAVDETDDPEALRLMKHLEAIDRMRERFTLAEPRT